MMFKLISIRAFLISAMLALALVIAAPSASAGDPQIEAAKTEGGVGERIDGYLGLTDLEIDVSLKRKIDDINARRRALYADLARESGTTVEQVARVTGEQQIANASPGHKFMDETGSWQTK